jgi:hypothetical protein
MKKVFVQNLYAVGMHHWGGKELSIGSLYYTIQERCTSYKHWFTVLYHTRKMYIIQALVHCIIPYKKDVHHTSIGSLYYCCLEEDNPKDQNAVATFGDKERWQRVAYFR